jgi:hypothetical protein
MTGDDRIYDNAITNLETLDVLANLLNDSSEFMPQDGGVRDPIMKFASINVQIGTADTCEADCNQHLVWSNARVRRIAYPNVTIIVKDACLHINSYPIPN